MGFNSDKAPLVEMKGICKRFSNVIVLDDVDFTVFPGEVHVLAGENGAGKSTLIKILSGVYTDFEGAIQFEGQPVAPASPLEANRLGISVIHQELSLIPSRSIAENMFLGRNLIHKGLVQKKEQERQAKQALEEMGVSIDVTKSAEEYSVSVQQLVEITKATSTNARVIIMDEPSSTLNSNDVKQLFRIVKKLKDSGCGIVYITHKMEEIDLLADRITVLRDGKCVGTALSADLAPGQLIRWMVGRDVVIDNYRENAAPGEICFQVKGVNVSDPEVPEKKLVDNVDFTLRKGEVLGIEGLQGSGASELLQAVFGVYEKKLYDIMTLDGKEITVRCPKDAIDNHICLLTNDRKGNGIIPLMNIYDNTLMPTLRFKTKYGWRNKEMEKGTVKEIGKKLKFRVNSYSSPIVQLSGGNQQKVLVAKWLLATPRVLLLDEPTKGIDIGAKQEIYQIINDLTDMGISVLLITSEMPELMALSDRIMVMHRGRITAEFKANEADAETLMEAAMGRII